MTMEFEQTPDGELYEEIERLESSNRALVEALEKAELWTDEENDVGEWRKIAEVALKAAKKQ